jgi:hypothetical protein
MRSNDSAKRAAHIEEPPDKNYVHHNEPRTGKGIHEISNAAKWEWRVITLQAPQNKATADACFAKHLKKGPIRSEDNLNHLTSCTQDLLRTNINFPRHRRAQKSRICIMFFTLLRPNEAEVLRCSRASRTCAYFFIYF